MNTKARSALYAMLLAVAACGGGPGSQEDSSDASSDAFAVATPVVLAPTGCQQTMCDFLYAVCESEASAAGTEPDPCPASRDACRGTENNALCTDDLGDPAPDGGPPCNADLSAAACACGTDPTCGEALLDANAACAQCNQGSWATTCLELACPGPLGDFTTCASNAGCTDTASCTSCSAEAQALAQCEDAAAADPSDPGGCYSGSHACWVTPTCA